MIASFTGSMNTRCQVDYDIDILEGTVVLGGIGTVFGAVAGALTFVILSPVAEIVGGYLPWISTLSSAQQSTLLFALVVCAFLLFEPLGLFGIWLRVKRYFLAWPFRY